MQVNDYLCHGFHASLANGRASGKLSVRRDRVTVVIAEHTLELPLQTLEVKMGGASNRLVFLAHPKYPEWSIYTSDRQILNDPHLASHAKLAPVLKRARRHRVRAWSILAVAAILLVAIPSTLLLRMDIATAIVAQQIPPKWEASLGDSTLAQYKLGTEFMPQEQAEALLQPLTSALIESLPSDRYDYQFHIANNATVNAFALPGGEVVIHSALILNADTAEELLGVLAHEIMHVENQHGVRNVLGAAGIYVLVGAMLGDVSGLFAVLGSAAPILLNQSYSRRFEREADRDGLYLLTEAGIRPQGMLDFFATLKQQEEKQLEDIEDEDTKQTIKDMMGYLSSHPATDQRIAQLSALIEKVPQLHDYRDLSAEFSTLKTAVKHFAVAENNENAYEK